VCVCVRYIIRSWGMFRVDGTPNVFAKLIRIYIYVYIYIRCILIFSPRKSVRIIQIYRRVWKKKIKKRSYVCAGEIIATLLRLKRENNTYTTRECTYKFTWQWLWSRLKGAGKRVQYGHVIIFYFYYGSFPVRLKTPRSDATARCNNVRHKYAGFASDENRIILLYIGRNIAFDDSRLLSPPNISVHALFRTRRSTTARSNGKEIPRKKCFFLLSKRNV